MKDIEVKKLVSLRNEIIESQKSRIDLLKYKLIGVATLGSIGLGLSNNSNPNVDPVYVICVIPFVCLYVDSLCWHNNLRILIISAFFKTCDPPDPYESFILQLHQPAKMEGHSSRYFFEMEDLALKWSTYILSFLIVVFGLLKLAGLIILSGATGLIAAYLLSCSYKTRESLVLKEESEEKCQVKRTRGI